MSNSIINERPYPGFRSFRQDEANIFFGREEQTHQLLERLLDKRFISVIGEPGCGKSSLIRAGILAGLENRGTSSRSTRWYITEMRPGKNPLRGLAKALLSNAVVGAGRAKPSKRRTKQPLETLSSILDSLSRGPFGLAEVLRKTTSSKRAHFLIIVDQFEELFRCNRNGEDEERNTFVNLLLASAAQTDALIHIVTTMRSGYVGNSALFQGLPEMINKEQFLVPSLTSEQKEAAIVSPAEVFGGTIEPSLVNHLLSEMENGYKNQLPLLQHCLMRMWDQGKTARNGGVTLTMDDYERVGGLKNALSFHANEVFEELDERKQMIAERMFCCLSGCNSYGEYVRYPTQLRDIATIAGVSESEVKEVVEVFRRPDRCFLLPPIGIDLESDTIVDVKRENLIQCWEKLKTWIEQEAESADIYRRLEHTACLWKEGKAALWGSPDLDIALQWEKEEAPVVEWAGRYGGNFELALEFLNASIRNQNEKLLQEEAERQRTWELESQHQKLQADHTRQKELERQRELQLQNLRMHQKELDLKHDRHLREKHKRWKTWTIRALIGIVAMIAIVALFGMKWVLDTSVKAQQERQQAILAADDAKKIQGQAVLNSSTYKKMVAATFRFISESEQNKPFFQWAQKSSAIETLLPGLHLMIDTSESINEEEKTYWNKQLFTMDEEKQVELLTILGMAAGKLVNVKEQFCIRQVLVKSEDNAILHPWDGTYLLKQGETILIDVDVNHPSDRDVKIEYNNIVKDSILSNAKSKRRNSEISLSYVASRVAGSRDLVSIKLIDLANAKIVDQQVVAIKIIESSLQQDDESN